MKTIISSHSN